MNTAAEYVLGTDEQELARLGLQHRLWADSAHTLWKRAGIGRGTTVLDVGCGPGFAARDLAELIGPTGRLVGVDGSEPFVAEFTGRAHANGYTWLEAHRGDVHDLGSVVGDTAEHLGGFDLAYARWVFCFLPRPEDVVSALSKLIKPGGRVAVSDYFNYDRMTIAPRDPDFSRGIEAVVRSWKDSGGDPDVMGRLPTLFRQHGFDITHLEATQHLTPPTGSMWTWPDIFWPSFIPRLVVSGHLSQAEADAFNAAWDRAAQNPEAFFLLPPIFDMVAVRR